MKTWQRLHRDPALFERYYIREKLVKAVRSYFETERFHEVDTPLLIANPPAESYLEIFETTLLDRHRNARPAYLSTSPETSLKKLMVAGIGNCYALTKSFRNMERQSNTHNPEFTILEWYRTGAAYTEIMADIERLILRMQEAVRPGSALLSYQGHVVDLTPPWERLTVADAFQKWAAVDFDVFLRMDRARSIAQGKGYRVETDTTWEELYNQIFLNEIERHLGYGKPTILYEFPGVMGALARKKPSDPRFAERFEFYIAGLELGDCYQELTDWKEQESRFREELSEIRRLGRTEYEYDRDFIEALKEGLPDSSGIAVGFDRLVMLFADLPRIQDALFFPADELFGAD